jgi:uncharacterized protein with HEPN domain
MNKDIGSLIDIQNAGNKITLFVGDKTEEAFLQDELTRSAVVYQLMIVGEATNRLSKNHLARFQELGWSKIIGMRNKLIHGYHDVNWNIVWNTVTEHLPDLLLAIESQIAVLLEEDSDH